MDKLLNFEFRKLFRQKSLYVCCAVMLLFIFLSGFLGKVIIDNSEELIQPLPTASDTLCSALSDGNAALIIGIFIALFVCEDYTDGTIKNIYSKGYSRTEIYLSKFTAVCVFTLTACAVSWIGAYISGSVFFGAGGGFDAKLPLLLAAQLVTILGYASLFFAAAIIFRKTGSAIAGCIISPMLFSLLFTTADSFIKTENTTLGRYWLDSLFGSLTSGINAANETIGAAVLMSAVYIIIFTAAGIFFSKKQTV